MSCFKNPRFAKELAYRTMANYYLLRDRELESEMPMSSELQRVINRMQSEGFDDSLQYEVTLALNSMLGLLVFPQQEYFSESISSNDFRKLPVLKECMSNTQYKNTYNEDKNKPANIIKHMRNALSHDRIMIIPESADNKDITHIRFQDAARSIGGKTRPLQNGGNLDRSISEKKRNNKIVYEFDLLISVDRLEAVLMEIAEYLIGFDK